jgi:hypothetical protein
VRKKKKKKKKLPHAIAFVMVGHVLYSPITRLPSSDDEGQRDVQIGPRSEKMSVFFFFSFPYDYLFTGAEV